MSSGEYVLGGMCPGGKCPGGKFPRGIYPWGKCQGGNLIEMIHFGNIHCMIRRDNDHRICSKFRGEIAKNIMSVFRGKNWFKLFLM